MSDLTLPEGSKSPCHTDSDMPSQTMSTNVFLVSELPASHLRPAEHTTQQKRHEDLCAPGLSAGLIDDSIYAPDCEFIDPTVRFSGEHPLCEEAACWVLHASRMLCSTPG